MGDSERRAVDKSEWLDADAYGSVDAYCSAAPLAACTPDTPIGEILPHFEEFTGALAWRVARPSRAERSRP